MLLVTGAAGFIGSNVLAGLEAAGYADLVACDRLRRGDKWRNIAKRALADLVAPERLFDWLDGRAGHIEAVVHMGAISATTETDADLIVETNFRLSLGLWDWCAAAQVPLIYASSAATYGDGSNGFDDDPARLATLRPLNAYGWSKHLFDRRVTALVARGAARPPQWAGLKFFNVFGANEYHKGDMQSVLAKNAARAAAGETVRLFRSHRPDYHDGGQTRDFVYVDDCVAVVLWLLEQRGVSGLFNVGTGQGRTFRDLIHALFAAYGHAPAIEYIDMPGSLRAKYQYFTEARIDRLRAAGFTRPVTRLETAVADYVRRYLATEDPYR